MNSCNSRASLKFFVVKTNTPSSSLISSLKTKLLATKTEKINEIKNFILVADWILKIQSSTLPGLITSELLISNESKFLYVAGSYALDAKSQSCYCWLMLWLVTRIWWFFQKQTENWIKYIKFYFYFLLFINNIFPKLINKLT